MKVAKPKIAPRTVFFSTKGSSLLHGPFGGKLSCQENIFHLVASRPEANPGEAAVPHQSSMGNRIFSLEGWLIWNMLGRIFEQAASFFSGLACSPVFFQVQFMQLFQNCPGKSKPPAVDAASSRIAFNLVVTWQRIACTWSFISAGKMNSSLHQRLSQGVPLTFFEPYFCEEHHVTCHRSVQQAGGNTRFFEASWLQDSSGTRGWPLGKLEGRPIHSQLFWTGREWVEDQAATEKEGQKN